MKLSICPSSIPEVFCHSKGTGRLTPLGTGSELIGVLYKLLIALDLLGPQYLMTEMILSGGSYILT